MTLAATYAQSFEPLEAGNLLVRIAESAREIELAQRLRFRIFCGELGAKANAQVMAEKRDFDQFDDVCQHMLVLDRNKVGDDAIVGTYRLLTRTRMQPLGRFYSESEFDIAPLKACKGEILELGRSCVDMEYRSRAVMQLLWRGIGAYVNANNVELMFGCASLYGIDVPKHAESLAYLYHYHLAPDEYRVRALPEQYVEMNMLSKDAFDAKRVMAALPPLIKGYLRLGGFVGEGAVVDRDYNTTDVGIIVKTELIADRYADRYATGAET